MRDRIKEKLEKSLNKIGWKLRDFGCEHYRPVDHKGRISNYVLFGTELKKDRSYDEVSELSNMILTLDNIKLNEKESFVCVGTKDNFILFMNHDKKQEDKENGN